MQLPLLLLHTGVKYFLTCLIFIFSVYPYNYCAGTMIFPILHEFEKSSDLLKVEQQLTGDGRTGIQDCLTREPKIYHVIP